MIINLKEDRNGSTKEKKSVRSNYSFHILLVEIENYVITLENNSVVSNMKLNIHLL